MANLLSSIFTWFDQTIIPYVNSIVSIYTSQQATFDTTAIILTVIHYSIPLAYIVLWQLDYYFDGFKNPVDSIFSQMLTR